jgi:cation diffusion facilitator CzcD-associated flavoprotein CzcO
LIKARVRVAKESTVLAKDWGQRQKTYDVVVVGWGYGGAITAERVSDAGLKKSVCILEQGKE